MTAANRLPILLGVLVLMLAAAGLLHGLTYYRQARLEVETLRLEREAALRRAQPLPQTVPADTALLLPAGSEAQAAATLVGFVTSVVEGAGGSVTALQPRAAEGKDEGTILLRAQFAADLQALQAALHAIEAAKPLLLVEALLIRARRTANSPDPAKLDVTLDLLAYRAHD